MDETTDRVLARRLMAGEERAFDAFFARSYPVLCRFALVRVGGDRQLAEDLAQATLCRAIDKLSTYNGKAALVTWLCTICRHLIAEHFARLARRPQRLDLAEESPALRDALAAVASETHGPDEELWQREMARRVQATLGELPARYAEALAWKYLEEVSVREIARRLGLSAKAAESLLTRARGAFREAFGRRTAELGPATDGSPEGSTR